MAESRRSSARAFSSRRSRLARTRRRSSGCSPTPAATPADSGDEHDPPECRAALDVGVRFGGVLQRKLLVDYDLQLTGGNVVEKLRDHRPRPWREEQLRAEEVADQRLVVAAHRGDVESRCHVTSGVAEGDDPTAVAQAAQAVLQRRAADAVDDEVRTLAARQRANGLGEVGLGVVDAVVESALLEPTE